MNRCPCVKCITHEQEKERSDEKQENRKNHRLYSMVYSLVYYMGNDIHKTIKEIKQCQIINVTSTSCNYKQN